MHSEDKLYNGTDRTMIELHEAGGRWVDLGNGLNEQIEVTWMRAWGLLRQ